MLSLGKRRTSLCINAQDILAQEVIHSLVRAFRLIHDNHLAREQDPWQTIDCLLVKTSANELFKIRKNGKKKNRT